MALYNMAPTSGGKDSRDANSKSFLEADKRGWPWYVSERFFEKNEHNFEVRRSSGPVAAPALERDV